MADHVLLGAMLTLQVVLTLVGLRMLSHVSQDAREISMVTKASLDAIALLLKEAKQE